MIVSKQRSVSLSAGKESRPAGTAAVNEVEHQQEFDSMQAMRPYQQPVAPRRTAFTLIEMLVVLAIIGILTAILVPVIGGAIRSANEFAIKSDITNIVGAIENYKGKTYAYPTDFRSPNTIIPHVSKLSGRADTNNLVGWATSTLQNPHAAAGRSTIVSRSPQTLDAAESWVFWLYETTNNPVYPLGAVWNGSNWVTDPNWLTVWDPDRFMQFDEKRLLDVDADGWFEYASPEGPTDVPYVYFDSRTYANAATFTNAVYGSANSTFGEVRPYLQEDDHSGGTAFLWYEPAKYQFLNCGLDGNFGDYNYAGFDVNDPNTFKIVPHNENITIRDRDNITNFTEGRIDKSFED